MVRHIMIAKQKINHFATLHRRPNAVIATACIDTDAAIINDALSASASIKRRSPIRLIHPSVQGSAESGCNSRLSDAIKSP
jgi:hypothetical protein